MSGFLDRLYRWFFRTPDCTPGHCYCRRGCVLMYAEPLAESRRVGGCVQCLTAWRGITEGNPCPQCGEVLGSEVEAWAAFVASEREAVL